MSSSSTSQGLVRRAASACSASSATSNFSTSARCDRRFASAVRVSGSSSTTRTRTVLPLGVDRLCEARRECRYPEPRQGDPGLEDLKLEHSILAVQISETGLCVLDSDAETGWRGPAHAVAYRDN